jgi:hypothetical protein
MSHFFKFGTIIFFRGEGTMTRLSEQRDVQDQLINHLIALGWRYLPPGEVAAARRNNEREPFLPDLARQKLVEPVPGGYFATGPGELTNYCNSAHLSLRGAFFATKQSLKCELGIASLHSQ